MSVKKRYCSNCEISHRVDGRPCPCSEMECPACLKRGAHNYSTAGDPFVCRVCGHRFKLSLRQRRDVVHRRDLVNCPRCGRKLRNGPRDKRRSYGLKS